MMHTILAQYHTRMREIVCVLQKRQRNQFPPFDVPALPCGTAYSDVQRPSRPFFTIFYQYTEFCGGSQVTRGYFTGVYILKPVYKRCTPTPRTVMRGYLNINCSLCASGASKTFARTSSEDTAGCAVCRQTAIEVFSTDTLLAAAE